AGHLIERHHDFAAMLLDGGERGVRIVRLDVERHMRMAWRRAAHAATDALAGRLDHAVVHRVVGVDLPTEHRAIEVPQSLAIGTSHLEPDDGKWHLNYSSLPNRCCHASAPVWRRVSRRQTSRS